MSDSSASETAAADKSSGSSASGLRPSGLDESGGQDWTAEHVAAGEPGGASAWHLVDGTVLSRVPPLQLAGWLHDQPIAELCRMLEGRLLGHFHLREFIGGGGMGAVFRGEDTQLGRPVAIKILSTQPGDEELQRRFRNEAQSAARLDHENIARVYYVGEESGLQYIVFEYIEGRNVRDVVRESGPLPLADAVSVCLQVADALAHASRRSVVHRDIKPSNVLITREGRAKLVDMGLARLHQVEYSAEDLTASGVTLGTFDYISPEQARDPRSADVRSDLYSLGCTFYFMLTAQPPFPDGTVLQKLLKHQADPPLDPRNLRTELPDELARIVLKLLAKSPADRYQMPDELMRDLLSVAYQYGLQTALPGSGLWTTAEPAQGRSAKRHLPWLLPTLILFGIAGLLDWPGTPWAPLDPPPPARLAPPEPFPAQRASTAPGGAQPTGGRTEPVSVEAGERETGTAESGATPEPPPAAASALPADASIPPQAAAVFDDGIYSVVPTAGQRRSFASLREAVAAAGSGDVIEFRFDGPRAEPPLRLVGKRLTLRGGSGFSPEWVVGPDSNLAEGPDPQDALIEIDGGDLTLVNLRLSMEIPPERISDGHAMFDIRGADTVRLERCWLTVRCQAPGPPLEFIRLREAAGAADPSTKKPARIALEHCVVRGPATFLRLAPTTPVDLTWQNGFLATNRWFCELESTQHPYQPANGTSNASRMELQYLTVAAESGLLLLSAEQKRAVAALDLSLSDSILHCSPRASLIEVHGNPSDHPLGGSGIVWRADRVFYEGLSVFFRWQRALGDAPRELDLAGWQALWNESTLGREFTPQLGQVRFALLPSDDRPTYELVPDDFRLDDRPDDNPALTAARDGKRVGFRLDLWPPDAAVPEKQQAEPPPR